MPTSPTASQNAALSADCAVGFRAVIALTTVATIASGNAMTGVIQPSIGMKPTTSAAADIIKMLQPMVLITYLPSDTQCKSVHKWYSRTPDARVCYEAVTPPIPLYLHACATIDLRKGEPLAAYATCVTCPAHLRA